MSKPKNSIFEAVGRVTKIKFPVTLQAEDIYKVLEQDIAYYKEHNPAKSDFERGFVAGLKAAQKQVLALVKLEKAHMRKAA